MAGIRLLLYRLKRNLLQPRKFAEEKIYPVFIRYFIIPVVLREKRANVIHIDFALANFHVLTRKNFYKIAGFGSTLEQEFKNWSKLQEPGPLKTCIPKVVSMKRFGFEVLITKRLEHLNDGSEVEIAAEKLLSALRSLGEQRIIGKNRLPGIMRGLEQVENNFGIELAGAYRLKLDLLLGKPLFSGPVHGDLHPGNILKDAAGNPQLIDWDCYEPEGIQALDALSLIVFTDSRRNNCTWCKQLTEYHRSNWNSVCFPRILDKFVDIEPPGIVLIFFLNQLGMDSRYFKLDEFKLKEVRLLVEILSGTNSRAA
jgi:hypothetical protein